MNALRESNRYKREKQEIGKRNDWQVINVYMSISLSEEASFTMPYIMRSEVNIDREGLTGSYAIPLVLWFYFST